MQKQNSENGSSPFAENVNIYYYFPLASQDEILEEIQEAVVNSVPFVTLVGDEGTGKTMLCKLLQSKLPPNIICVYLPKRVESFEDVLRLIIQEVGVGFSSDGEQKTIQDRLQVIKHHLEENGQKLLIIFDEAENVYLATLERARKMLDQVNSDGSVFKILLAGRSMLQENLRQLSMVNFNSITEKHFTLSPLSSEETHEYLNFTMKRVSEPGAKEVFTREASDKIFEIAKGNFRMTNILAEEALQNVSADTSFLVLLDNVRDKKEVKAPIVKRRLNFNNSWWKEKRNLQMGGAVGALLVVVLLLFSGNREDVDVAVEQGSQPVEVVIQKVTQPEPEPKKVEKVVVPEPEAKKVEKVVVPEPEPQKVEKVAESNPETSKTTKESVEPVKIDDQQTNTVIKKDETSEQKNAMAEPKETKQVQQNISEAQSKVKVSNTVVEQQTKKESDRYDERVVAGIGWLNGSSKDKFTIQLMVLTSDGAEQNLRKMLKGKDYKDLVDAMYILQKEGTELPILVFYGEYPTMSAARNARNTLSQVLRKHHPYAISIEGAVQKAQ